MPRNKKSDSNRPYYLSIAVYIILILSVTVYAIDAWDEGYRVYSGGGSSDVIVGSPTGLCYTVTNDHPTEDFFIPTRSVAEWDALEASPPADIYICDCGFADCDRDRTCECDLSSNSCSAGACVPSCSDLCTPPQTRCPDSNNQQTCGDCDADPCWEWCSTTYCGPDGCDGDWSPWICDDPYPRRYQYQTCHDRGCAPDSCYHNLYFPRITDDCTDNVCWIPYCSGGNCYETPVEYGNTDTGCIGTTGCAGTNCICDGAGSCIPDCYDDCSMGQTQCDGNDIQDCGEAGDGDSCLDWITIGTCGPESTCSGASCSCNMAYEDCDSNCGGCDANGCETFVYGGDSNNCGGCGITCVDGTVVVEDYCVFYNSVWYVNQDEETGTCLSGTCEVDNEWIDTCVLDSPNLGTVPRPLYCGGDGNVYQDWETGACSTNACDTTPHLIDDCGGFGCAGGACVPPPCTLQLMNTQCSFSSCSYYSDCTFNVGDPCSCGYGCVAYTYDAGCPYNCRLTTFECV